MAAPIWDNFFPIFLGVFKNIGNLLHEHKNVFPEKKNVRNFHKMRDFRFSELFVVFDFFCGCQNFFYFLLQKSVRNCRFFGHTFFLCFLRKFEFWASKSFFFQSVKKNRFLCKNAVFWNKAFQKTFLEMCCWNSWIYFLKISYFLEFFQHSKKSLVLVIMAFPIIKLFIQIMIYLFVTCKLFLKISCLLVIYYPKVNLSENSHKFRTFKLFNL